MTITTMFNNKCKEYCKYLESQGWVITNKNAKYPILSFTATKNKVTKRHIPTVYDAMFSFNAITFRFDPLVKNGRPL